MGELDEKQGVATSAEQMETSVKDPETFTKEQMEAERKGKSDALADIGRLKTEATKAIKAAQGAEDRIAKMLEEQDEADRAKYRDEPDKLNAIDERGKRRTAEAKLTKVTQELGEVEERVKAVERKESESTKERNARETAARLNVDPNLLVKLATITDGSPEAIEAEAKFLPKLGETKALKTDTGTTTGGGVGKKPTLEELKASDPVETDKKVKSGEWLL